MFFRVCILDDLIYCLFIFFFVIFDFCHEAQCLKWEVAEIQNALITGQKSLKFLSVCPCLSVLFLPPTLLSIINPVFWQPELLSKVCDSEKLPNY